MPSRPDDEKKPITHGDQDPDLGSTGSEELGSAMALEKHLPRHHGDPGTRQKRNQSGL